MILRIRTLGDPVLREPARPVTDFGPSLRSLFDDGETGPMFMANPELADGVGELLEDEGCLSIPGPYHATPRFARILCRGQDLGGKPSEMVGEGLLARIFQHETDHLDGMLYIDRLDDVGRRDVMAQLRRIEMGLAEPRTAPDE